MPPVKQPFTFAASCCWLARMEWIAVDWGTSHVRAWAMGPGDTVLHEAASDRGMGRLAPEAFEPALLDLVGGWLGDAKVRIIVCGMAGARGGWAEAPYVHTPCAPPGPGQAVRALVHDPRLDVRILPGVAQMEPPDVMRGEETQIAGFLTVEPAFDGVLVLPGTHTKWVRISAGEIVGFRTFVTGESFALLAEQSVLRAIAGGEAWDAAAFLGGVKDGHRDAASLTGQVFGIRAAHLLAPGPAGAARARLSGLLIGAELAAARGWWLGQDVVLLGEGPQARAYAAAQKEVGVMARVIPVKALTLKGLCAANSVLQR